MSQPVWRIRSLAPRVRLRWFRLHSYTTCSTLSLARNENIGSSGKHSSATLYIVQSMFHSLTFHFLYLSISLIPIHSAMECKIIFRGNSSISNKIFALQKLVTIMVGTKHESSYRNLFKTSEILPLPCEHIFSLMNFIVNNQNKF